MIKPNIGREDVEKELADPRAIEALHGNSIAHIRSAADLLNLVEAFELVGFDREEAIGLVGIYYGAVLSRHFGGHNLPMVLLGTQAEPFSGPAGKA